MAVDTGSSSTRQLGMGRAATVAAALIRAVAVPFVLLATAELAAPSKHGVF